MSTKFHIKAPKSVIERIVRTAHRYTDQETASPAYLKLIHMVAEKDGLLTVTAESQYSAIKMETEDVEIVTPGELMVQANWLSTALDTVQPDEDVDLSFEEEGKKRHITVNNVDMLAPITGEKALVPTVGKPDYDNGIKMAPEEFAETYLTASVARSLQASRPIVQGVFAETDVDAGLFRLMSFDAVITSATDATPAEIIGDGAGAMILKDDSIRSSLDYIKEGNSVELYRDSDNRVHVIVKGKGNTVPYHIRVATLDYPIEKYPSSKVKATLLKMAGSISFYGTVEKAEFLRVVRNSANIGSLDINNIGGQAKYVNLSVKDGEITSSVVTDASYEESIPMDLEGAESVDVAFHYPFGTIGHLFDWYHNQEDPQNIHMAFLVKEGQTNPYAIVLYKGSVYKDGSQDELADYFCLAGVSPVQKSSKG